MPCYHPLKGWRSKTANPSGKRNIVFNLNQGYVDQTVEVPCGQCIGCRLERSRQWAIRCSHEASLYKHNEFITLTYAPAFLPENGTLVLEDFQKFMKRLRKKFGAGVRFFHCGEYGEKFQRPHYHACLFNIQFKDRYPWKVVNGVTYFRSPTLEELWPYGQSMTGDVTFESAAYVARYITKKITGDRALHHYNDINTETGEILRERKPEYTTMSRRPGIGKAWLEKYQDDIYPDDFVLMRGKKLKPPKYYDTQFELIYPEDFAKVKYQRKLSGAESPDNTRDRLDVREEIQYLKKDLLIRGYEK